MYIKENSRKIKIIIANVIRSSKGANTFYVKSCNLTAEKMYKKLKWMFSDTEQGSHQVCQFFLSVMCVFLCVWLWWIKTRLFFAVGFPEWSAQFYVWEMTGKDSSAAGAIACQNWAVYSVFSSGMTPHSKIVLCNWECVGSLTFLNLNYT
jgi:hypothetical protein